MADGAPVRTTPAGAPPYSRAVTGPLPLFPLGMVLFPGLVLPLHVFEDRYRVLIRDLLELPEDERRFGVVAIREGREVGSDGITALHEVGCTAQLRQVETYDDGRADLVTVGADRFRLTTLHDDKPYFTADVEWLPEDDDHLAEAGLLDVAVRSSFGDYLAALSGASGGEVELPDLPAEPLVLSYLIAATMLLDLDDRQGLLAEPDGRARLRRELSLLRREAAFLRVLAAAPAPELTRTPISPN